MNDEEARHILASDALLQQLAAVEHERWSHWQKYMHEQGQRQPDGALSLPPDLVRRWETQIQTAYADLSRDEQESDIEQVRQYIPLIAEALGVASAAQDIDDPGGADASER